MIKRSPLERVPRRGQRQLYRDRVEWHWYQRFYPEDLQLTDGRLPVEEWWQWRGHAIHLDRYSPPGENTRATVVLLHGGGGNGRVLSPLALMLIGMGVEVVAPDLPGYGLTVRERGLKASYGVWSDLVIDLVRHERASAQGSRRPVFLWGLSLGGMLAYAAAARLERREEAVEGIIATTLADTRRARTMAAVGRNALLGYGGYLAMKLLGPLLAPIRVPIKWVSKMFWISNDPALARVFMRDRLAGGATVTFGFLTSLATLEVALEPEELERTAVLLAHPALDPWTPLELSREFFDRLAGEKELVVLEGCGHLPIEAPGVDQLRSAVDAFIARRSGNASRSARDEG